MVLTGQQLKLLFFNPVLRIPLTEVCHLYFSFDDVSFASGNNKVCTELN